MLQFLLFNPWGEALLLLLVAALLGQAHRREWITGRLIPESIGYIVLTAISLPIPGVFFFLTALAYVLYRLLFNRDPAAKVKARKAKEAKLIQRRKDQNLHWPGIEYHG